MCIRDSLHTGRSLGRLTRRVRADRRPGDDLASVDLDAAARHGEREPVEAARGGPGLLLADAVVLRAVAWALEPLRRVAPRNPAAQVHALLVQRDVALFHAGYHARLVHLLGLLDVFLRVGDDVGLGGSVVEGLLVVEGRLHVVDAAYPHLAAETGRAGGPQERQHGDAEPADREALAEQDAPVEELAAGDAELLFVDRHALGGRARACRFE